MYFHIPGMRIADCLMSDITFRRSMALGGYSYLNAVFTEATAAMIALARRQAAGITEPEAVEEDSGSMDQFKQVRMGKRMHSAKAEPLEPFR